MTEKTEIKEGRPPNRAGDLQKSAPSQDETALRGWICYDGDCPSCTAAARRFERSFLRHGFQFVPMQTQWVQRRLGLRAGQPLDEMRVLTREGVNLGGADAIIFLARQTWWGWPFYLVAQIPGARSIADRAYQWIAARRGCTHMACKEPRNWGGWIGLMVLPLLALFTLRQLPPWGFMWLMAGAIFFGCKWLTFWRAIQRHVFSPGWALGYLFAWPGMDPNPFFGAHRSAARKSPPIRSIAFAVTKILFGFWLLFVLARIAPNLLLTGWIGMIGLILILHFGLFQLFALNWQAMGVDAKPIMDAPWRSVSLGEFWSRRWNGAFNRLALDLVFRPLARPFGVPRAMLTAFLVSGLIHELAISLPAHAGYGLPTAYFLLQGWGVLAERTSVGKRLGLGKGVRGWTFTILLTALPAFWLFHPPFVRQVIIPFMQVIHAL